MKIIQMNSVIASIKNMERDYPSFYIYTVLKTLYDETKHEKIKNILKKRLHLKCISNMIPHGFDLKKSSDLAGYYIANKHGICSFERIRDDSFNIVKITYNGGIYACVFINILDVEDSYDYNSSKIFHKYVAFVKQVWGENANFVFNATRLNHFPLNDYIYLYKPDIHIYIFKLNIKSDCLYKWK